MTLYKQTIPQLLKMITNLEGWLTQAEAFCAAQDIPIPALLDQKLYPNMYDLRGQLHHGCYNIAMFVDRLGDTPRPDYDETEQTLEELRELIARTKAFVESVDADKVNGAADRMVTIPKVDGMEIRVEDLMIDLSLPNIYFHLTIAYAIMRSVGVPLGKSDYLGPMALVPAS